MSLAIRQKSKFVIIQGPFGNKTVPSKSECPCSKQDHRTKIGSGLFGQRKQPTPSICHLTSLSSVNWQLLSVSCHLSCPPSWNVEEEMERGGGGLKWRYIY